MGAQMDVYEDNFGFWNIDGPDECAFFEHVQRQSLCTTCERPVQPMPLKDSLGHLRQRPRTCRTDIDERMVTVRRRCWTVAIRYNSQFVPGFGGFVRGEAIARFRRPISGLSLPTPTEAQSRRPSKR
jgi:hypothetical protein